MTIFTLCSYFKTVLNNVLIFLNSFTDWNKILIAFSFCCCFISFPSMIEDWFNILKVWCWYILAFIDFIVNSYFLCFTPIQWINNFLYSWSSDESTFRSLAFFSLFTFLNILTLLPYNSLMFLKSIAIDLF